MNKLPELLSPAGSPTALRAAVEGGADAVYMGMSAFNARIYAKNFTTEELAESIRLAHAYGTKVYIAMNTMVYDRELTDFLRAAEQAYLCGADALIVADLGGADAIRALIPIDLHASTQIAWHNVNAARLLAERGFSRMVAARELSAENLKTLVTTSPIETEVFVHGALCVSHSGQCLFSSIVGGRSGNRGECAQPCRLPYRAGKGQNQYPLSLKDLSLAEHLSDLCQMGVASLKIEGRMKSPEYVRDVTRIWRRLLDESRNATKDEMVELAEIFSRGGFTDGYYTGRIDRKMLGIRTENDKQSSRERVPFSEIERKIPITLSATVRANEPMSLTVLPQGVTVHGQTPETARNAPIETDTVSRSLSKWGGTPYTVKDLAIDL
ncbi:MAG: U32 family peptidase, partial [Clostridia bacterium]|nr:U32 family peptidase [Clostridia bacterium]